MVPTPTRLMTPMPRLEDRLDDDAKEWLRLMNTGREWSDRPLLYGAAFCLARQAHWVSEGSREDGSYLWYRLATVGSRLED